MFPKLAMSFIIFSPTNYLRLAPVTSRLGISQPQRFPKPHAETSHFWKCILYRDSLSCRKIVSENSIPHSFPHTFPLCDKNCVMSFIRSSHRISNEFIDHDPCNHWCLTLFSSIQWIVRIIFCVLFSKAPCENAKAWILFPSNVYSQYHRV